MIVPEHMEITASLMAGYTFEDGSVLEVDSAGDYRITDASGDVLIDTLVPPHTDHDIRAGAMGWEDYGEIADDLAAFLGHDAEIVESADTDVDHFYEDAELLFPAKVARWAKGHSDELSMLACYMEDKRLEEEE